MAKVTRTPGDVSLDDLTVLFRDLGGKQLATGWFEAAKYDDQTPAAFVASVQEFGTAAGGIPPRPVIRPTIANHKDSWIKLLEQQLKLVVKGGLSYTKVLDRLGLLISGQIRQTISTVQEPPLSPITLALRKQRLAGKQITGATVGATAAAIAAGDTAKGQLGDTSGINPKPLVFTSFLLQTVTHEVRE